MIALAFVFEGLVEQHALPVPVAAGIDVAKRLVRDCIALQGQCLLCFGSAIAQMARISKKEDRLVANRRAAVLARVVLASLVWHSMSFLGASALVVKASIRRCLTEGLQVSSSRDLGALFLRA